jgi:membrane-bound serine protease (ClpP class)
MLVKPDVITRSILAGGVALALIALLAPRALASDPDAGPDASVDAGPSVDAPKKPYAPAKSQAQAPKGLAPIEPKPGATKVLVIPISDTVELGLAAFLKRSMRDHPEAAAIILDIDTFGGRVDAAVVMRDALLEADVPTIAYVHPRAISAGALISLACDLIVMGEGASIGAATPFAGGGSGAPQVDEKMTSYMRTEMRATAESRGRRGDIAEAMVDADVEIDDVIIAGKVLTLDTDRAVELGMADGEARSLAELLEKLGLERLTVVREQENWGEKVARFLTEPTVSSLLLSVGMLALMMTFYTQNFGALTLVGLIALGLFFGGHSAVELVGLEEVLLLVAGILLLGVELFVLPGFGVAGILGLGLILASLVMAMLALPLDVSFDTGLLVEAIGRLALSIMLAGAMALVAVRFLPRTQAGRRFVLATETRTSEGYVAHRPAEPSLVGAVGEAATDLRPTGKVRIEGELHDGRSERAFLAPGSRVRVIRVEGHELVVREEAEA